MRPKLKVCLVSNIPAPYREPVYENVSRARRFRFLVVYCRKIENNRQWYFSLGKYPKIFLKKWKFSYLGKNYLQIHFNPDVWSVLNKFSPDVVITNGYNPTHLLAFLWAWTHGKKHIAMTDGWLKYEEKLTAIHRFLRRFILKRTEAFIGPSQQSLMLFRHYGAASDRLFVSHLCASGEGFSSHIPLESRKYDLMFSGQLVELKNISFFLELVEHLILLRPQTTALILGDGPLRHLVENICKKYPKQVFYPGFIQPKHLSQFYENARIFVFPTRGESWGVVINEACASGMAVVTSDRTAAAGELVVHGKNGYVFSCFNVREWGEAILRVLENPELLRNMSEASKTLVRPYNYPNAAQGILNAVRRVYS